MYLVQNCAINKYHKKGKLHLKEKRKIKQNSFIHLRPNIELTEGLHKNCSSPP